MSIGRWIGMMVRREARVGNHRVSTTQQLEGVVQFAEAITLPR